MHQYINTISLLRQNSKKTNEPIPRKAGNRKMAKGNFPKKRKSVIWDKKYFRENDYSQILGFFTLSFYQKSGKTNELILHKD